MKDKPNCCKCVHRLSIPGDAHSRCNNHEANVNGNEDGIRGGWFNWPLNFDPIWLEKCDGFSNNEKDKTPRKELDSLAEVLSIFASVGR